MDGREGVPVELDGRRVGGLDHRRSDARIGQATPALGRPREAVVGSGHPLATGRGRDEDVQQAVVDPGVRDDGCRGGQASAVGEQDGPGGDVDGD